MFVLKFRRLDHIQICIPKDREEEARQFYSGLLGLIEIPKPAELVKNGGLWYKLGDIQLHIGIEDQINTSKRHPAFEVEELKEVEKYFKEKGIKIREEIQIHGQFRFSFQDPFGNRIELLEKEKQSSKI